ncbi:hypothetical protein D9754_05600 [Planomicrobium sp. Y74]|nr:hypothetical protein D9754_05600 [Planomicrobium sp. Y74]
MALFAIAGSSFSCVEASEAMQTQDRSDSRGWAAGVWTREKCKRPFSSDKRKTIWRSGVFSAAQPKRLTTRGVGRWSLDKFSFKKC